MYLSEFREGIVMKFIGLKDVIQLAGDGKTLNLFVKIDADFSNLLEETSRAVVSEALFGTPLVTRFEHSLSSIVSHGVTEVEVSITVDEAFIKEFEEIEAKHEAFLNGAAEVLNPMSEEELRWLAVSGKDTFVVEVSPFFFDGDENEQQKELSKKLIGTEFLEDASFFIEQELIESPIRNLLYVRFRILNLLDKLPAYRYRQTRKDNLFAYIQRDYPHHEFLHKPLTTSDVEEIIARDNLQYDDRIPIQKLVEISSRDLDIEIGNSLNRVIQNAIYRGSMRYHAYVTYIPVGVNPMTFGTIFKVDGSIAV